MGFSHNLLTFLDQTINQDGRWNRAGSLAPFQSAFTTPLQAKWMHKPACCPVRSVSCHSEGKSKKQFGCSRGRPDSNTAWKWERCIVMVSQMKIKWILLISRLFLVWTFHSSLGTYWGICARYCTVRHKTSFHCWWMSSNYEAYLKHVCNSPFWYVSHIQPCLLPVQMSVHTIQSFVYEVVEDDPWLSSDSGDTEKRIISP